MFLRSSEYASEQEQKLSLTRKTTVAVLFSLVGKRLNQKMVDTVVNTFRLAGFARALTNELVYGRDLQRHRDGLQGASSGSRTPSVFLTSLPGRKGEGRRGQMRRHLSLMLRGNILVKPLSSQTATQVLKVKKHNSPS